VRFWYYNSFISRQPSYRA